MVRGGPYFGDVLGIFGLANEGDRQKMAQGGIVARPFESEGVLYARQCTSRMTNKFYQIYFWAVQFDQNGFDLLSGSYFD